MTPEIMADIHAAAFTQSRPWNAVEFANLMANRFNHTVGDKHSFALIQVIAGEAELITIATHPDYQRRGLARRVMTDWHTKARVLGVSRAFLDVASDNLPAISLYQAFGYTPCATRKGYYRRENCHNVDAIVMECRLSGK
ncbi:ribosomal-protein-alanine N-acetyltransferase [Ruegeria halocynthiae]|uniref:Ribosomal-protein-alanine N-acetyltransferase n=1 Tax=Ruegeria halocynthiae TaxID=985054 RepID=A0A1H2Z5J0_9RHOB|nr:N-acetyltransferase [Ruegeria halocynthiae]SDX12733.1 ribosomal-protein-alanine N-acetyltransferase [Ruegeria halocynthiae]